MLEKRFANLLELTQLPANPYSASSCALPEPSSAWCFAISSGTLSTRGPPGLLCSFGFSSSLPFISCTNSLDCLWGVPCASSPCCLSSVMNCRFGKLARQSRHTLGSHIIRMTVSCCERLFKYADFSFRLYSLAPYRLATVAGGMLVAFIWTIFPSPLATDRNWLRLEISSALYLLANYFSAIQETMKTKLREELALESPNSPNTVAYRLQIARETIFSKLAVLVPSIEEHLKFQRWEPTIGGSFPRELYEDILLRSKR